jgi:hypothetical protein
MGQNGGAVDLWDFCRWPPRRDVMAGSRSDVLFPSRRETKLVIPVTCISRFHPTQLNGPQTNKHGLW